MSSIDNNLGGGGGSASASGKKGAIQLSDGNFNLTSNKELKSDPKTGTITTTGLTTTGTVYASTVSATTLIVDTLTESLTVVGDASITGDATVDGTISTAKVDISGSLTTAWATVSGTLTATSITGTSANIAGEIKAGTLSSTGNIVATGSLSGASLSITGNATVDSNLQVGDTITVGEDVVVTIKEISAGDNHTALVDTSGILWGTGDTRYLGVGSQTTYNTFTQIPTSVSVANVACGNGHTMIIDVNGTVSGTGLNSSGQLGIGGTISQTTFTSNATPVTASKISCGLFHTMIIDTNGTVSGTGNSLDGQLGIGSTINTNVFTSNATPVTASQIACGSYHTMIIDTNGTVSGTGLNANGQLGIDSPGVKKYVFTSNATPVSASKIACGPRYSMIIDTNGTVSGTGRNIGGQLGINNTNDSIFFVSNATPVTASQIACGSEHTMIIDTNGTVSGTGGNYYGEIGIGSTNSKITFTSNATPVTASHISCGGGHTMIIDANGTVSGTGLNTSGQLGIGSLVNSTSFTDTNIAPYYSSQATEIYLSNNELNIGFTNKYMTIDQYGNVNVAGSLGIGTTDTAEYNFLVKDGTSNLFGVPLSSTGLTTGKTLVYDGSGWVYDNAGPADGTQTGEILAWNGSEWSANSALVVEGSNVGIGTAQPTQKLDVIGNVRATHFIGSGDTLANLNASNIISGTLDNARLPQTISVSNLEATANLVVGGPADITGTLSASSIIGSGAGISTLNASNVTSGTLDNARLPQTISVSNLEATANLVVNGPADITGTLSVAGLTSSENVTVTGNNILYVSNIETSNLTVTNSQNVLGNLFVSHTVSAPTLLVGNDARVTGNLTVSGGVVSITTTTTGTSNIVITNAGTGPVLVATQLGNQPIANFIDGMSGSNVSALFISGGEQTITGRDGFVGLGTTLPTHRLDVQGDANVATNLFVHGTLSTSNLLSTYRVQGATLSSTGQIQASGTITTSDSFLHHEGTTTPSPYMRNSVSGLSTNTYVYTRAIVNPSQIGDKPAAIVFGDSNTFGNNQISLATRGENRLYIDSSDIVNFPGIVRFPEATSNAYMNLLPRAGGNANNAIEIYQEGETPVRTARIQYNGDADFRTITVSNIQGGSPLTISASGGTINVQSDMIMVGSTLTAEKITGNSPLSLSAGGGDTINVASDMIMVDNSIITAGTIYYTTLTTEAGVSANISAFDVTASNSLVSSGNAYITSNLGVGTTDTAEYKFLVKNGSSNLFGVPYDTANLSDGKTIVYNGSDWVYDNAGPADGTQSGEILTWNGSEWSANSAVVVEGSNVGIGSTQPREILDVAGNVRITQSVLINETFQGRAMRLNDTPASNLHYQPNFTITGSLTSAGDIKTNQAFRGHNMFLSNVLTISGGVVTNTGTVDTTVNGTLTVQGDAVVNSNISAVSVNTGDVISNRAVHGKAIRLGNTPESNVYYNPNLTVTGSITAGGDVKSGTTFRGPDMVLSGTASIGTLTTSNIVANTGDNLLISSNLEVGTSNLFVDTTTGNVGIGITTPTKPLHVVGDSWITGTLTTSNIVGASPVTISSDIVMASGFTLTAGAIQPPAGGGTLTTSNIVGSSFLTVTANTNVVAEFTASEKLIKYPRVKMTAATTSGYTASASSYYNNDVTYIPWHVFDGVIDDTAWLSAYGTYNGSGIATSSDSFNGVNGSYITIELPTNIKLNYAHMYGRDSTNTNPRRPKTGILYGSTDNSSWTEIGDFSITSLPSIAFGPEIIPHTTGYYKYFRLQITSIFTNGNTAACAITELELYGYPENDLGDGTDVIFKTVPNTPKTDFLEVYYDASNTNSTSTVVKNIVDDSSATPVDLTFTSTDPKTWYFNGTTSNVTGTHGLGTGNVPHSHAVWFKRTSVVGNADYIVSIGTRTNSQASLVYIYNNKIYFDIFGQFYLWSNTIIENDTWYHYVVSYNGQYSTTKIYINGQPANYTTSGSATLNLTSTTLSLGSNSTSGEYFNGSIANYRLYDRALSADEVWELYGYQKAYFSISPDVVTYKAGRVGIGTSEPRAVLDVVGDIYAQGGSIVPAFNAYKNNDSGQVYDQTDYIWNSEYFDRLNNYDTTNGRFTAPSSGYYYFWASFELYGTSSSPTSHKFAQFYKNGSLYTPTDAYTPVQYGSIHSQLILAHVIHLEENDYVTVRTHGTTRGMQSSFLGFKIGA